MIGWIGLLGTESSMSVISQQHYGEVIVVGNPIREKGIGVEGGPQLHGYQHCSNIYDALVSVVMNRHGKSETLICIRVDGLTTDEMEIFRCLSGITGVTAVAFSTMPQPVKLAEALRLGARETLTAGQLFTLLAERGEHAAVGGETEESALHENPKATGRHTMAGELGDRNIEMTKMAEKVVAEDLSRLVRLQIGQSRNRAKGEQPPGEKSESQDISSKKEPTQPIGPEPVERPALNADELEALLGGYSGETAKSVKNVNSQSA
jgi:hypothetical protein